MHGPYVTHAKTLLEKKQSFSAGFLSGIPKQGSGRVPVGFYSRVFSRDCGRVPVGFSAGFRTFWHTFAISYPSLGEPQQTSLSNDFLQQGCRNIDAGF